jgi:uncharacterized membrane-anchored protein YhcB (DUF1043 family)
MQSRSAIALVLGAVIGAAGVNMVNGRLFAADDNRQQRMDEDKWTSGDRARDALDHLKKAETEMKKVSDDEGSKVAKDAAQLCSEARTKVDQFVGELDKKEKKKG